MLNVLRATALRERLQRGLQVLENISIPEDDTDLAEELQVLKDKRRAAIKSIDSELNKPVIPIAESVRAYARKEFERDEKKEGGDEAIIRG